MVITENNIKSVYIKEETHNLLKKEIKTFHLNNNYSSLIKRIIVYFYPSYEEENSDLKHDISKTVPKISSHDLDIILYTVQKFNTNKYTDNNHQS